MSGLAYHLRVIALALLIILLYGNQSLLEREGGGWQTLSLSMVQPLQTQEGNRVERHSWVICLHVRKPVGRVWPIFWWKPPKAGISWLPDKAYICAGANLKLGHRLLMKHPPCVILQAVWQSREDTWVPSRSQLEKLSHCIFLIIINSPDRKRNALW